MRILFLNSVFPGRFRSLAQAFGASQNNTVLFLAETGQKLAIPGVRRLRLAPPAPYESDDPAEKEIVTRLRRGARAGNALLSLRRNGFIPDIVCAAASMGGSFYVRDIFPKAFYVAQGDWFYNNGESHCFFTRGNPRPPADFAPLRVCNLWEYNALGECQLAVTSSLWQRAQYPPALQRDIKVVPSGINTRFFMPGEEKKDGDATGDGVADSWGCASNELVTFCGPMHDPARGFDQFRKSLPRLLELRPNCLVVLAWLDIAQTGRKPGNGADTPSECSETGKAMRRAVDILGIDQSFRARVHLLGARSLKEYRAMLQHSTAHVYLAAPHVFSTGLLEAMACGSLVVASDTPPVREVVQDGVNGFLCDFWDHENMAQKLADVLARAPQLGHVRRNARQTVLRSYDADVQTRRFMDLISASMKDRAEG
ncbi:glycosyltransferase [Desulfovibrio sp. QI0434]